ncbi:hypothetical protein BGX27_003811, partial [Mortierella sp. AM989]
MVKIRIEEDALEIKIEDAAFNITANFHKCRAGYYNVRWRIKTLDNFSVPNGLHFTVKVSYKAEPEVESTLNVYMPGEKLSSLKKNQRHDLELEETFMVHPHLEVANVRVALCSVEKDKANKNFGLVIQWVEIRPISKTLGPEDGVERLDVERDASHVTRLTDVDKKSHITRIAASKSANFLASLALSDDKVLITVWDMEIDKDDKDGKGDRDDMNEKRKFAVAALEYSGNSDISLGLAISANGDQIAVYQEPKIGQWKNESTIEKAEFPFTLFDNTLVHSTKAAHSRNVGLAAVFVSVTKIPLLRNIGSVSGLESFIGYAGFVNDRGVSKSVDRPKSRLVA